LPTSGRNSHFAKEGRRQCSGDRIRPGDVFVFLLLVAQYESVLLPLAVILIVPRCLLAAIGGVLIRGMENSILTQIGFVC